MDTTLFDHWKIILCNCFSVISTPSVWLETLLQTLLSTQNNNWPTYKVSWATAPSARRKMSSVSNVLIVAKGTSCHPESWVEQQAKRGIGHGKLVSTTSHGQCVVGPSFHVAGWSLQLTASLKKKHMKRPIGKSTVVSFHKGNSQKPHWVSSQKLLCTGTTMNTPMIMTLLCWSFAIHWCLQLKSCLPVCQPPTSSSPMDQVAGSQDLVLWTKMQTLLLTPSWKLKLTSSAEQRVTQEKSTMGV